MERYFLIKSVCTATERNQNFHGEQHVRLYGKAEKLLFSDSGRWYTTNLLTPPMVREYGYTRKADAVRSWIYRNPDIDEPYWETDVSIVQVWVKKDNTVSLLA